MFFFRLLIVLIICIVVYGNKNSLRGPTDGYYVSQIHLAQGSTPESMTISWITNTTSTTTSTVKYGLTPHQLTFQSSGIATSYNYTYYSQPVYYSGIIHHVSLQGLEPSKTYYYQCGDFSTGTTSGILSFTTLPAVGNPLPLTFGVIGDLGTTLDSQSTLQHMVDDQHLKLILHAGDLSYADCQQPVWDTYGEMIEDLSKERPWMVGPGNHEIEFNNDGSMFLAFEERYKMPAIKPAEIGPITIQPDKDANGNPYCSSSVFQSEYNYGNSFYSFETGPAHIIYLNPYSTTDENSIQYKWLAEDLSSINREKTPWIIAVMHCPWYSSNTAHYGEKQTVLMRDSMETLLYKNHVNVVITGHVHAYERTFPVYQNNTVSDGIVYITIGDGGNREGHANTYYEQPNWSAYRNGTQYGHGSLQLVNHEKLVWRWYRNVDGNVVSMDEMILCNSAFMKTLCSFSSI